MNQINQLPTAQILLRSHQSCAHIVSTDEIFLQTATHYFPRACVLRMYSRLSLNLQRKHLAYVFVFGNRLSRKKAAVFPFAFHIAVQQSLKPLRSRLLLYDLEPSQAPFALHFKSLLMTLVPSSEEFYRSFLLLGISLRLVPTLLTCPA
jgi:hypothetical protein